MNTMELSRRARIAWMAAELELVLAVLVAFAMLFLYVAAPGFPDPYSHVRMAVAIGLATIGFTWMILIYRDAVRT